jgi:hypothetical protein
MLTCLVSMVLCKPGWGNMWLNPDETTIFVVKTIINHLMVNLRMGSYCFSLLLTCLTTLNSQWFLGSRIIPHLKAAGVSRINVTKWYDTLRMPSSGSQVYLPICGHSFGMLWKKSSIYTVSITWTIYAIVLLNHQAQTQQKIPVRIFEANVRVLHDFRNL